MADLLDELQEIADKALALHAKCDTPEIQESIKLLLKAANQAEQAHSGSWLGYQACVYYEGFQRPPSGAFFDKQGGLKEPFTDTIGDWVLCNYSDVYDDLKDTRAPWDIMRLAALAKDLAVASDELREELLLLIEACKSGRQDDYLDRMKEEAAKARMSSAEKFAQTHAPKGQQLTRDQAAIGGGFAVPPHVAFRAHVESMLSLFNALEKTSNIAKRTASYLTKRVQAQSMLKTKGAGTKVFVGHGGKSKAWLELKNFVQSRLNLPCEEFTSVATAGMMTGERLEEMLSNACFAFLVMTAEDELADKRRIARLNVVHEVGLFQGRLGYKKAIVVLEEGCEEFSNIHGIGQIRFKDDISHCFHEVADVLKRENIIK